MQTKCCTWSRLGAKVKFAYGANFAYVSKSVHMDIFEHVSKFVYMQINTHVCKSVHVNWALDI